MPRRSPSEHRPLPAGLIVLYEDRDIIVVDKPAGLLTISTLSEKMRTAQQILTDYVRKGCAKSRNRVFVVHRLDRHTSGVLIFAKSENAKRCLQEHWDETEKTYLAIVYGKLRRKADTITTYLAENAAHMMYSTSNPAKGKRAHTAYRVLKETRRLSLLEVNLITGRKHQIRVHLAGIGHPIVGDRMYGRGDEPGMRLALHARSISFRHPFRGRRVGFEAAVPEYFEKLVGAMTAGAGTETETD